LPEDLNEDGSLIAGKDYYIGKAWCFGSLILDRVPQGDNNATETPGVMCDSSASNKAQGDLLMSDVSFSIYQVRSNKDFVCDSQVEEKCFGGDGCMFVEFMSVTEVGTTSVYTFEVVNNCDRALSHVAFELPDDYFAISPLDGEVYNGVHNDYDIENTTENPFHSIKFETIGEGIKNGETETFEYSLANDASVLSSIKISLKAGNETYEVSIDIEPCLENEE